MHACNKNVVQIKYLMARVAVNLRRVILPQWIDTKSISRNSLLGRFEAVNWVHWWKACNLAVWIFRKDFFYLFSLTLGEVNFGIINWQFFAWKNMREMLIFRTKQGKLANCIYINTTDLSVCLYVWKTCKLRQFPWIG